MTPADETEFVSIIAAMAAQKPGKPLTAAGIELFWLTMQHWTIEDFKQAAMHLMRTQEFMPNAYHFEQIRKAATENAAAEAWQRVLQVVRTAHWDAVVTIDSRTDRVVRAMGGYRQLGMTNSDQLHNWTAKRFGELWEELGEVDEARAALPRIAINPALSGPARANPRITRQ